MLKFAIIRVTDTEPDKMEVLLTADVEDALVAAARSQVGWGRRNRHEKRVRAHYKQAVDTLHQQTITLP